MENGFGVFFVGFLCLMLADIFRKGWQQARIYGNGWQIGAEAAVLTIMSVLGFSLTIIGIKMMSLAISH